jgi:hypothetical protein
MYGSTKRLKSAALRGGGGGGEFTEFCFVNWTVCVSQLISKNYATCQYVSLYYLLYRTEYIRKYKCSLPRPVY